MLETLDAIAHALRCQHRCPLGTPGQVLGEGPVPARVAFVAEAPGAEEVRQGRPLVGNAGRVFNRLLAEAGLRREEVYITNALKCRPPGNRAPRLAELEACQPFLLAEIRAVDPQVVVTLGAWALRAVTGQGARLAGVHARPLDWEGRTVFPLYHPAAAFYREDLKETLYAGARALAAWLAAHPPAPGASAPRAGAGAGPESVPWRPIEVPGGLIPK